MMTLFTYEFGDLEAYFNDSLDGNWYSVVYSENNTALQKKCG